MVLWAVGCVRVKKCGRSAASTENHQSFQSGKHNPGIRARFTQNVLLEACRAQLNHHETYGVLLALFGVAGL